METDTHRVLWVTLARDEDPIDAFTLDRQARLLEPARELVVPVLVADRPDREREAISVQRLSLGEKEIQRLALATG